MSLGFLSALFALLVLDVFFRGMRWGQKRGRKGGVRNRFYQRGK
jgi:hypothetical protein